MMGGGRWFPWCMALASLVCRSPQAAAEEAAGPAPAAQVRVLSATSGTSVVTVRATPAAVIEDRTPGSKPVGDAQGPAAKGKTFADEVTLFLSGFVVSRAASIDVDDPLVSTVRLLPEAGV